MNVAFLVGFGRELPFGLELDRCADGSLELG